MALDLGGQVRVDLARLTSLGGAQGFATGRVFQRPGPGLYDVILDEPLPNGAVMLSWAPEAALEPLP
ncbi:MAG: hypothetical protein OXI25_07460 [Chloroflexota bacterium]|nr:hypothetical protein [Chloroflexota bacterium]